VVVINTIPEDEGADIYKLVKARL